MVDQITLLTVDDDESMRRGVRAYFEDFDFRVLEAADGETGLSVFREESPDVAVVDLRMPGLSGLDVIQVMALEAPEIPTVVLSGTGVISDAIDAIRKGAWDFVTKPIKDMAELHHVVSGVLERARLRLESRQYREHLEQEVARRTRELTEINNRLRAIVQSTRTVAACNTMQEVSSRLLEEFACNMAAEGGSIYLVEEGNLVLRYSLDEGHTNEQIPLPPPVDSPIYRALATRQPLVIRDLSVEAQIKPSGWGGYRDPSLLIFPLLDDRNEPIGVITLHNKKNPPFTEQDREIGIILSSYSYEAIKASKAIDELRKNEERFKRLLQNSNDIITVTDARGIQTSVNGPIERILGYKPDELIGVSGFSLVHPEDLEHTMRAFSEGLVQPNSIGRAEYRGRHKDGTWITLEAAGTNLLHDPIVKGVVLNVRDITDRKRAEEALHQSEARYRALYHDNPSMYFTLDTAGTVLSVNRFGAEQLGYSIEELVGQPVLTVFHPDDREAVRGQLARFLENPDKTAYWEFRKIRKDGSVLWVGERVRAVVAQDGSLVVLVACEDITERKCAEQERRTNLKFFECMDRVNRAIQGTNDLEKVMSDVLNIVLSAFDCDRAFLLYPCNPEAASWTSPMERTKPEYPGALTLGLVMPMDAGVRQKLRALLSTDGAVKLGPGSDLPVPEEIAERFDIKSLMSMAVYPKMGDPWEFGIQQCSYPRIWTHEDERLLQEIGRRLGDALTSLLTYRHLKESEAKLAEAERIGHIGYWDCDLDADSVNLSAEAYRILGLPEEEYFANLAQWHQRWLEVIHPEDRSTMSSAFEDTLRSSRDYNVEYRILRSDGEVRIVHAQGEVTRDESGRPHRAFGTVHDITERNRAARDLLRYSEELEMINLLAQGMASSLSLEQVVERGVRALRTAVQSDCAMLFIVQEDGFDLRGFDAAWGEASNVQFPIHRVGECLCGLALEYRKPMFSQNVDCDGRCTWEECKSMGLKSVATIPLVSGDDVVGVLGLGSLSERDFSAQERFIGALAHEIAMGLKNSLLFEDLKTHSEELEKRLSDLRQANDERDRLHGQLLQAQKMEAIGTLAGGIAHDFNNLLQAILGYSDLLLMKKGPGDPDRKKLEVIQHAARDGADLVARILTFSRKSESRARPIDLNEEIRKAQRLLRRTVPLMIDIELVLEEDLHVIDADPAQVEQILLNLAVNAQHAMPDGGKLIIETSNESHNDGYLKTHLGAQPGHFVRLTVSDTGSGIQPEVLDRIFEPFFTTKTEGEGTGLGLSMVHGIVTQHGGYIRCHSEPGRGTSFKIYFPVSSEELISDLTLTREMPAFGTETILLVDDDDRVREMGRQMIEMGGYSVFIAKSGEEALEIYSVHKEEIALIILDLIMPRMGGKRCLEELLRINPEVRVLVASGYSSNGFANGLEGSGAKGFVSKPYDAKDILTAIRRVLDEGQL